MCHCFSWRGQIHEWCPKEGLLLVGCWRTSASWWYLRRKVHRHSCCSLPVRWTWLRSVLVEVWWGSGRLVPVQVWAAILDHRWAPWSTAALDPLHENKTSRRKGNDRLEFGVARYWTWLKLAHTHYLTNERANWIILLRDAADLASKGGLQRRGERRVAPFR